MLFSTFSGTRFQTNLKKIRQIQTNFGRYNVFLKMFLTFYQNVSEKFHFLLNICLFFSNNLSAKCQYPPWKCVWIVFNICLRNVNISPEMSDFCFNCLKMSIFFLKFCLIFFKICLRNVDISQNVLKINVYRYIISLIPNWYFMCN